MLSPMRPLVLVVVCAAAFAAGCTDDDPAPAPRVEASIDDWRWAPKDDLPAAERAEEDKEEPRDELPAAAPSAAQDDAEEQPSTEARAEKARTEPEPPPEPPKVDDLPELGSRGGDGDKALVRAEVLENGIALPPLEAPPEVRAIFEAGNVIARSPYKWGGGHGKWQDNGYDCSGSVSYALAAGGFVNASMPSGGYMKWGKPGKGKWITIYTNPGHMFMVVAGVRFDTVARGQTGSRWINSSTDTSGYVARHPPGY
jgi:cell wall-associated NlpC family hydrolase